MPPPTDAGPLSEVRRGVARGAGEAVRQAPGLVGAKAPGAAGAAGAALQETGRGLMQSAIKPGLQVRRLGKAEPAVETMLQEGLNVTKGGVAKLQNRIGVLNDQITELIKNSPALIDKEGASSYIKEQLDKFTKQVDATSDVAAIQKTYENFLENPLVPKDVPAKTIDTGVLDAAGKPITKTIPGQKAPGIPVPLAQELKQGTYRTLGSKSYGEVATASKEAQKAIARFLKDKIAEMVPEVRPLNAREGRLLGALDQVEARVLQAANRNPIGLGWLTLDPVKFAGWMADRSELFKSIVARMLYSGGGALPGMGAAGVPMGMGISGQAHPGIPPPPQ
jgi:hypothetical protein